MIKHGCGVAILSHKCTNSTEYEWISQIGENRILLIQRGITAPTFPGCWAFPAGLAEPGETPREAAIRETLEEIGVEVSADNKPFWEGDLNNRKLSYFLGDWKAPEKLVVQINEVSGYGWFTYEEALRLPLAFRYAEVIKSLQSS